MRPETSVTIGVAILLAILASESGVLPYAFAALVLVGGVALWLTSDWQTALHTGGAATLVVTAFGIASFLSPGWYQSII